MSAARNAVVLGSTGGMGAHTIESFASDPHTQVIALAAAGTNLDFLAYQAVELEVFGVALRTGEFSAIDDALNAANERVGRNVRPEILIGPNSPMQAASAGVDIVVNAISGIEGVGPSLAGLESGAQVWLANTESLMCRELLQEAMGPQATALERIELLNPALLGIQSTLREHDVTRIVLTTPTTPDQSSRRRRGRARRVGHLTGFTTGIASLELRVITDVEVDVVGHDGPVASIVELADGRRVVNVHDGATPAIPSRRPWRFSEVSQPGIELARMAGKEGKTYPIVLFESHHRATQAHLNGEIKRDDIGSMVAQVLDAHTPPSHITPETLEEASLWAGDYTQKLMGSRGQ